MKTYKHRETGAVLLSESEIAGDWELVKEAGTKPKSTKPKE